MQYSLLHRALAASTLLISVTSLELTLDNEDSIRNAAADVAHGLMANYKNNQSSTALSDIGSFGIYWWNSGAIWGGMVDYITYTGDQSYVEATTNALAANVGENHDIMLDSRKGEEGTDDQAFWALTMMTAAEANLPVPEGKPNWVDVADGAFKSITSRWDDSSCNGGFQWQIFDTNFHGVDYKNSVANGGLFQLAARLAYLKKDDSYAQWAEKVYDWTTAVGFISENFEVYDGAGTENGSNCSKIDHNQWTYNNGMFTYGSAAMYAHTGDQKWLDRTNGFVKSAGQFFNAHAEAPGVLTEIVCEKKSCNMDQQSFKAYLARWLAKTSALVPETAATIKPWLEASAKAAAESCSGDNNACGQKWFTGGFDGVTGINQQLCAMETIQSLLVSTQKMYGQLPSTPDPETSPVPSISSAVEVVTPSSTPVISTPSEPAQAPSTEVPAAPSTSQAAEPSLVESSIITSSAVAPTELTLSALPASTDVATSAPVEPPAPVPSPSPDVGATPPASVCEQPVIVTETITESELITSTPIASEKPSFCETPVIVTVTETLPAQSSSLPEETSGVVPSEPLEPSIPVAPSKPATPIVPSLTTGGTTSLAVATSFDTLSQPPTSSPTPTPPAPFLGSASDNRAGSAMFSVMGSIIALAIFL